MGSMREREERERALAADDTIARPAEPRGARSVVGQTLGANVSVRTRQLATEATQQDAATPAARAYNERAAIIDFYADKWREEKAAEEAETLRKQQLAANKLARATAQQEQARKFGEDAIARMNRDEIKGILADDMDLVEEVTTLAKSRGQFGNPIWYQGLLDEVKARKANGGK